MSMEKDRTTKCRGAHGMVVSRVFVLLLVVCLVECAAEQRISKGKPSQVDRINGWRSQRGGSCLSYGHSCWGAHGKRSGKLPASAPDWYLARLLRRMTVNAEMSNSNQAPTKYDLRAIFGADAEGEPRSGERITDDASGPVELPFSRNMEAKPMLDEDMLSKIKMWQIMKESSEEN